MMQPTAITTDHSANPAALATYAHALLDAVYPFADTSDPDIASFRQQVLAVVQDHSTQPDAVNTVRVQQVIQQLQSIANEREGASPTPLPFNNSNTMTASHINVGNQSTFSSQVSYSFGPTYIFNPPLAHINDPAISQPTEPVETPASVASASNTDRPPHPLALPLAKLYQRLAFIRLPLFVTPQSLSNSYVHLMLIHQAQQSASAKPENITDTSDSIVSPWLNRYRSYEDIYAHQSEVPPETLCQSPSRAIVIGRAGVGKSTFCRYGLYRWSLSHNSQCNNNDSDKELSSWWTQYDLVFWIPLRSLLSYAPNFSSPSHRINDADLAALIRHIIESQPEATEEDLAILTLTALTDILNNKNLNILYLLDGFDEAERLLYQTDSENTCRIQLLEFLLRKKAYVLTLRPHAMENAMTYQSDTQALPSYELMGFANDDISDYVERAFRLNRRPASEGKQLLQQLESNISMWSAAHTPILLALLCALWKEDLIPLDKTLTMTQLYIILVERLLGHNVQQLIQASSLSSPQKRRLLERYNYKTSKTIIGLLQPMTSMSSLTSSDENEDLSKLLQPVYHFLSKIAFKSLQQNTLILRDDYLVNQLEPTDLAALKQMFTILGYGTDMQEVRTRSELLPWLGRLGMLHALPAGQRTVYEFPHLSFQEYLGAHYLTNNFINDASANNTHQVSALIVDLVSKPAWQIVLAFTAGQLHQRATICPQMEEIWERYLTLLAHLPMPLQPQLPYALNCAKSLLDYPKHLSQDMIQRTLLLAYALEESELAAIPEKALILEAMKACGIRALLFPRDFSAFQQARLSIVQAFKLCPHVFAASGLLDRLRTPKDYGIVLPETIYLAQAALLQIKERRTLAGLMTLLQNALNAELITVQLQIIEDIWSWAATLSARETVITALGLCLCSSAHAVRDKARAYLAKKPLLQQPILLQQAAHLALHTINHHTVKAKAALIILLNAPENFSAWQALMQALSAQHLAFLTDMPTLPSELEQLPNLSPTALLPWKAKTIGWLLTHRVLDPDDHDRVEKLLPKIHELRPILLADWIARLRANVTTQVKLAILQHFAQFYPWEAPVLAVVLEMLAAEEMAIRAEALNLIQSLGLQTTSVVIHAHINHLQCADPWIKQEAMQALSTLAPGHIDPSMLAAVCQQLGDENLDVRKAALTTLAKWELDKTAAVIQTHRDNCSHPQATVRQTASEMLIVLANTEPQAIDGLRQLLSQSNPEIRQRAADALIRLQIIDQPVIDALRRNLYDDFPYTRQAAADTLIRLQITDQPVIEALCRNLKDFRADSQQAAADALSRLQITDQPVIDALCRNLKDFRADSRQAAANALIRLQITDQPVIDALHRNLYDDFPYTRQAAADALSRLAPTVPPAIDALRLALSTDRAEIRQVVADTLIRLQITDQPVIDALCRNLKDFRADSRQAAADALSRLAPTVPPAIDALRLALSTDSADGRQVAADALIRLQIIDQPVIDALRRNLYDDYPYIRQAAADALSRLAPTVPPAIDALRLALSADRGETRQVAANALIRLQVTDQSVIDALRRNLKDDYHADTRQAAADALIRLQIIDQLVVDALRRNLKGDYHADTRQAAADALIRLQITDQPVIDALHRNLYDYRAIIRQAAADALSRLAPTVPPAIDALRLALSTDRAETRQVAANALIRLQVTDQSVIDALRRNLKDDYDADIRQKAAAALQTIESNTFPLFTPPPPQPINLSSYQRISSSLMAATTFTTEPTHQNDLPSPPQPMPVQPPALDQNVILANYHSLQQQPNSTAYQRTDSFDDELVYSDPEEEFSEDDEQDEDASQANLG